MDERDAERELERARRLEQLYHSALEHPAAERTTFVAARKSP